MDIPLLYTNLPMQFRIIAKLELFKYPFMGWHLSRSGQIPIDDRDMRSNLRSLQRAVETVKAGMPVVVFPEGGRSADGVIKDFKPGAFRIATKAVVPVIPMAIVGTYEVLKMNHYVIRPGRLQLVIGRPIPTDGYSSRELDSLSEKVKTSIEDMYYARAKTPRPVAENESAPATNTP
jgi:1-acyl-sn-glycerol-3-phosphate acyltransferase